MTARALQPPFVRAVSAIAGAGGSRIENARNAMRVSFRTAIICSVFAFLFTALEVVRPLRDPGALAFAFPLSTGLNAAIQWLGYAMWRRRLAKLEAA